MNCFKRRAKWYQILVSDRRCFSFQIAHRWSKCFSHEVYFVARKGGGRERYFRRGSPHVVRISKKCFCLNPFVGRCSQNPAKFCKFLRLISLTHPPINQLHTRNIQKFITNCHNKGSRSMSVNLKGWLHNISKSKKLIQNFRFETCIWNGKRFQINGLGQKRFLVS